MGWVILVIGLLFLVAGLVISIWEAFSEIGRRVEDVVGGDVPIRAEDLTELIKAIAKLVEGFAKLTVGIQLSLVGLVLVYCGLRIVGLLAM
jgi:uncharacterized membrane protein